MPDLTLNQLDFGDSAADHETSLSNYFYKNQLFEQACEPSICLILGEKGAGKSAIFKMMNEKSQETPHLRNPNLFIPTVVNLREHFHLLSSRLGNQVTLVTLWRFYFASIATLAVRDFSQGQDADFLDSFVKHWELNPQRFPSLLGGTVKLPLKLAEVEVKRLGAGTANPLQLQEALAVANRVLSAHSDTLWIALDELDKVAIDGQSANGDSSAVLSALMQIHSELFPFGNIRFKFFIRSDVYETLTYVDKDHFSNAILRLKWEWEDLAIMLALRIKASIDGNGTSVKLKEAEALIGRTFDWPPPFTSFRDIVDDLRDGRGAVTPRDLLNFSIRAQQNQARFNSYGTNQPSKAFISAAAVEKGLEEASQIKLDDFLTTFPEIHKSFCNLQGHTAAEIPREELKTLLNLPDELNFKIAIEQFWRIGVIGKKGLKPLHLTETFVVPRIYRRALGLRGEQHG